MINNPTRDIHTDYAPNDVFRPAAANALTASVEYDYVITKERIDAFRAKHSYTQADWMDVGALLWEDYEGLGPAYPTGRSAIHILINCHTTAEDRFAFHLWLNMLSSSGVTEVHVHSLSSYRSQGGSSALALYHHTLGTENCVLFDDAGMYRGKALYVGSFACTSGTAIWQSGAPFVYERCLSGEVPHGSLYEAVDVRQEPWMSNRGGTGGGHAIAVMLAPQYCGAPSSAVDVYAGATNGHALHIDTAIDGGPVQFNGAWANEFVKANTVKVEGQALADADPCQSSLGGLDVSGLSRLDIFTAAGIITLPKGTWYTATNGNKTYHDGLEYAFGNTSPSFYIKGSTLQEGQQLEITISIVQFPPHSFVLKADPCRYMAPAWTSGAVYHVGDVVSYSTGGVTSLYEALVEAPSEPGSAPNQWEILDVPLEGPHMQAIPGRTKVWSAETYYSLYVVDDGGTQLPLYSWGYADASRNGPIINGNGGATTFSPMHPSFIDTKSSMAGASPAGFSILAASQTTLCKVDGKVLVLGSAYSGYFNPNP